MAGIAAEQPDRHDRTVRVTETAAGRQQVSVTSETRSIFFTAEASQVERIRVYLQGSP